jgi:peptidoglycan/LPS O-acetylase OafA/YrhL
MSAQRHVAAERAVDHRPVTGLPYLPGIDALRALAVLAVLLYHAQVSWLPGGFLGVDVFFVISGYLITSLLVTERAGTGTIGLGRFWMRRARRLLPASFVMVGVCLAYAVVFLPDDVASLRGAAVASFGYVTNWYLVFSQQSYFESFGRPSLFRHLWSLAVEEQFYLFWPVVFAAGMKWFGRRVLLLGVVAGIVGSTALMWVIFDPTDPSRVYYGTDTRLAGLLCGVALALVWHPRRLHAQVGRRAPMLLDTVGVVALALLLWQFTVVGEFDAALYQGGFLKLSILTAVLLAVVAHPAAHLGRVLGFSLRDIRPLRWFAYNLGRTLPDVKPLIWVGLRSYSIYLWHWPIFMVTRPRQDIDLDGWQLLALRVVLSLVAGALSYRFVEDPIRHGALQRWRAGLRPRGRGRIAYQRTVFASFASVLAMVIVAGAVVAAEKPEQPEMVVAIGEGGGPNLAQAEGDDPGTPVLPPTTTTTAPTTTTSTPPTTEGRGAPPTQPTTTAPAPTTTATPPQADYPATLAIGDSVMLGAQPALEAQFGSAIHVDAKVARQFEEGIWVAQWYRDQHALRDIVIVHLGNNGYITDDQFDQMMDVLSDVPRVIFVTARVNQRWQDEVNSHLLASVEDWPNAEVIDWKGLSQDHPDWFYDDQTHLKPDGAANYAQLLAGQVSG